MVEIEGRTFPVRGMYLEDVLEGTGERVSEELWVKPKGDLKGKAAVRMRQGGGVRGKVQIDYYDEEGVIWDNGNYGGYEGYRDLVRGDMRKVDEGRINYGLIVKVVVGYLKREGMFKDEPGEEEGGGSVLVFMPGKGEIERLRREIEGCREWREIGKKGVKVHPLHSSLDPGKQSEVLRGKGVKVIISTNIAETSVTIESVTMVVDAGLVREVGVSKRTGSSVLECKWTSRASTMQRQGRAGRVREGVCIKMFSKFTEREVMRAEGQPEIGRMPLEEVRHSEERRQRA